MEIIGNVAFSAVFSTPGRADDFIHPASVMEFPTIRGISEDAVKTAAGHRGREFDVPIEAVPAGPFRRAARMTTGIVLRPEQCVPAFDVPGK